MKTCKRNSLLPKVKQKKKHYLKAKKKNIESNPVVIYLKETLTKTKYQFRKT